MVETSQSPGVWRQTFAKPGLAAMVVLPPAAISLLLAWLFTLPFDISMPFWQTVFTVVFFSGMMFIWLRWLLIDASPLDKLPKDIRSLRRKFALRMVLFALAICAGVGLVGVDAAQALVSLLAMLAQDHTTDVWEMTYHNAETAREQIWLFVIRWLVFAQLIGGMFVAVIWHDPVLPVRAIGVDPARLRKLPDMRIAQTRTALGLAVIWAGIGALLGQSAVLWEIFLSEVASERLVEALQQVCLACAGISFATLLAQPFLDLKRQASRKPAPKPAPDPQPAAKAPSKPHRAPFRRYKAQ
ncbi:hypothetical protein [Pacificoceanicola onchidii]|uniref:hypothetical protein n=1 Tax=Pacificoceanicola onchidii TaxID=2562685 RepID=UPI0010A6154C|nr:hypothetical protein [Pacificoceanicola onchidii]